MFSSSHIFVVTLLVQPGTVFGGQGDPIGCYVPAQCLDSDSVGLSNEESAAGCQEFCSSVPNCNYWTHYNANGVCFALSDCVTLDPECQDCVSGKYLSLFIATEASHGVSPNTS